MSPTQESIPLRETGFMRKEQGKTSWRLTEYLIKQAVSSLGLGGDINTGVFRI